MNADHSQLDPELAAPLDVYHRLTGGGISLDDINAARNMATAMATAQAAKAPAVEDIDADDRNVSGGPGNPEMAVRIYRPTGSKDPLPALLWLHGGGYVMGSIDGDDYLARQMARSVQCLIASVEYRLAPEHPFPAPLDDCYAALAWLAGNANELGINPARIAVGGASAGGGLAAGLALLARDRAEIDIAFQLLIFPMLDDRNIAPASGTVPDTYIWTRANNRLGWRAYLGTEPGGAGISPYAAPARATNLSGLPPAYIPVGNLDLFLQEDRAYARRLANAGVPTELKVYPGAYHGFSSFAPKAAISQRFNDDRDRALRQALHS